MAGNSRAFVETWFGVLYAGCAVVPIPVLSAPPEVAFRLGHARCDAIYTDTERGEVVRRAVDQLGAPVTVRDVATQDVGATTMQVPVPRAEGDTAMILYTSGTTGTPKGAAITHGSLTRHTEVLVGETLRLGRDDVVMGVLPLTHSYGIRMAVLVALRAGARTVVVPRFDARRVLELAARERVTWLPVVPTMLAAIAGVGSGEAPAPPLPALRWCLSAGSPLAEDVRRRAEARLGVEVRQGYGLTEATFTTLDAPPSPRAPGSVGRPVPGIEVRIVDDEERDVATGEQGQVLVRGHNVMGGYVDDPEATREVLRGGWMHTGDVGRLDAEGRLTVVDRIKDMIIRGGNNVYPSEVEDALSHHPAIAELAVVGRPDAHYGEEVVAVVVLRAGAELSPAALDRYARERLARNKVPREVVFVDALPLGPSRKVLKRELRRRIEAGELVPVPIERG